MFTKRISRFLFSIGAVCLFAAFTHCAFGQRAVVPLPSLDSTNGTSAWLYSDPTLVKYVSQPGEEPYLAVSNPSSLNKPAVSAALDLPLDKVRGCLVFVSVFVRVSNVSEPGPWPVNTGPVLTTLDICGRITDTIKSRKSASPVDP